MATVKELQDLAIHAVKHTAPANYSCENVEEALRTEMRAIAGSVNLFMKNRYDIYEIIIAASDEVVPNRVMSALGAFADVRQIAQGQKAVFKRAIGKQRGKKFLTQVGLSGVYETFRLDTEVFEVNAHAVGGGATIDFERFLDGDENMSDIMEVITDGITDAVFGEVQKALKTALTHAKANVVTGNSFVADDMVGLVNKVKAYGTGAVIFAPPEFIAAMGADAIVPIPTSGNYGGVYSPKDIDAIHDTGFINIFRGTPIVQIPQSYVDENNDKTLIDPQCAYVLPTGKEKVVKVVLEGQTQINDFKNRDNSMEIYAYKKMGCAVLTYHNWGIYQNTGITQTL